jgi:hypothetical protein
MSRYDNPKIHLIPSNSQDGRRLIRNGQVVNVRRTPESAEHPTGQTPIRRTDPQGK